MSEKLRLGIDLGGTSVKLALVSGRGDVAALRQVDSRRDPKGLARDIREAVRPWLSRSPAGTGVGVAGDVDPAKGLVRFAPNLRWKNVPLKKILESAGLPRPIHVENDATAAAWGAYHKELKGKYPNLVVLTLGTGVGGGIVIGGRLYRGATGTAGELGHMTVDPRGPLCGCGSRGCLEAFMGGVHLVKRAREEMRRRGRKAPADVTPHSLFDAARGGDALARGLWRTAGTALGVGLASLINIFNPDAVLLCGGVAGAAPEFLPWARREIRRRAFQTPLKAARLIVSSRSRDLGVIGAALLE